VTRRLAALLAGLNVLGNLLPLSGNDGSERPVEVVKTDRVDFAAGGLIRLNGTYGYLSVDGWDEPQVEITITKSTNRFYKPGRQEEAKRRLESIRVVTERRPENELSITTILPSRNGTWAPPLPPTTKADVTVEYLIRAPRDSRLVIHHGPGQVLVSNMTGDVEATSLSGDIMLILPATGSYSIDARSKFGTVSSDFAGDSHRRHLVGSGVAGATPSPSHRIYVRTGLGGIAIKADPAEIDPSVGAVNR
jgi:hypothetical protein